MTASIFTGNYEYRHLSPMKSFKTIENDDYVPQMISNDTIKISYGPSENASAFMTTIQWQPAAGEHISD